MTSERVSHQGEWSGSLTFFLAATGAVVGLGNIWKFPYVVGQNGGGAFVLTYLLFVVLIGLPIFMSEVMLGRRGRQSPYNSFYIIASEDQKSRRWAWLGGMVSISGFLILSYYSVVGGEVIAYAVRAASGTFTNQSADGVKSIYNTFRDNPEALLAWHTVFMVITCLVVSRGVKHGLEKTVKILIPALLGLLLILVAYTAYTGSFVNGASYMFDIDFKKLLFARNEAGIYILDSNGSYRFTFKGILTAMGHAFFTLSLGVGAMMIFGSYLKREVSIAKVAMSIAFADTLVAIVAGLAIFPIVFTYGLSASQGPGLVFTTLPIAFGSMYFGSLMGTAFFLLLFFAALTSAIALIEPTVIWLVERRGMTRVQATAWAGIACWLVGIISVFSESGVTLRRIFYVLAGFLDIPDIELSHQIFDLTGFQIIDSVVTLVMLPVGGFLIAIFAGWIMSPQNSRDELNLKNDLYYKIWQALVRYIAPALVFVIFVSGLIEWIYKYLVYQPVM
ncbi:MAG TPA: sodium-dependent transporter [Gammaproteobacteria bacterium]|nr:sodium-dependent transporter [Gammaproteobacteria bacterium]